MILLAGGALAVAALYRYDQAGAAGKSATTVVRTAADPAREPKPNTLLPATLEWPADAPRSRSETMAYAALFRAWGADYRGGDPCRQAEGLDLRCRTERGGLAELRQLNRPAVLRMRDGQGQEFHAALLNLGLQSATFAVAAKTRTVALAALAAQWSGYYSLLWRLPPAVQGTIRPGDHGPAVAWLRKQLAQGRTPETTADPVFDEDLVRLVKQFQLAQGLIPDGSVGPQTLIRLVGESDESAPTLVPKSATEVATKPLRRKGEQ